MHRGPKYSLTPAGVQLKTHRVSDVPGRLAVLASRAKAFVPRGPGCAFTQLVTTVLTMRAEGGAPRS